MSEVRPCPLCGNPRDYFCPPWFSKASPTFICVDCRKCEDELVVPVRLDGGRFECLHYDDGLGVSLVSEDPPGAVRLFGGPGNDPDWCRHYVNETNDRLGVSPSTAQRIIAAALAAR